MIVTPSFEEQCAPLELDNTNLKWPEAWLSPEGLIRLNFALRVTVPIKLVVVCGRVASMGRGAAHLFSTQTLNLRA